MSSTMESITKVTVPNEQRKLKPVSWAEFQRKYLSREDGFKYEWLNGIVEKTKSGMDKTQLYILRNLLDHFRALFQLGTVNGQLISEPNLFFLDNHRRPDVAWLTNDQIDRLAYNSKDIPAFIIEVISTYDQINKVELKMENYRDAGVQVVWHVFPNLGKVHVYGGERLNSMQVLSGSEICSASPALPSFELTVDQLLIKPLKPN